LNFIIPRRDPSFFFQTKKKIKIGTLLIILLF